MRGFVRASLASAIVLAASYSCSETTGPKRILTVPKPAFAWLPSTSGNLPVLDSLTPANSLTLPPYADSVIAEFTVDGGVGVARRRFADENKFEGGVDAQGYTRNGVCRMNVKFTYVWNGVTTGWGPGACMGIGLAYKSHWVDTAAIQGNGTLSRGGPIYQESYECPNNSIPSSGTVCWSYDITTGHTFVLRPLPVLINLATPQTAEAAPGVIEKPPAGIWTLFRIRGTPDSLKLIRVPVRVVSWRWEAAAGGTGQTVLTGGATAIQRSAYITEEGRMIVSAFVNGVEQVDSISVVVPVIKIVPQMDSMRPSIRTPKRTELSSQTLMISASGFNNVPLPNKPITLTAIATEGTAGHAHTGGKPAGDFLPEGGSTRQINTGQSGTYTATYLAADPSGPVTIRGTSPVAATANKTIAVGIPGLVRYLPTATYDTTGGTPFHLYTLNHYADHGHLDKLNILADLFYTKYGTRIKFNDSSLPLGGLFDVAAASWYTPHLGHREGKNTDVKTLGLTPGMITFIDTQWRRCCGQPIDETNKAAPHYHLVSK